MQTILAYGNSIIAIAFILGSCIFVHELGHFLSAKLCKMRIEEFMIGFPPRLLSFKRGETKYGIGLLITGGFCRIAGMEPGQEQVEGGFYTRPRLQQAFVLVAGAAMNVLLGAVAFMLVGLIWGMRVGDVVPPTVDRLVTGDTPARASGLQPGDQIAAVDGHDDSLEITEVKPGSLAERLGMAPGDQILAMEPLVGDVPVEATEGDAPPRIKGIGVPTDVVHRLPQMGEYAKLLFYAAPPPGSDEPGTSGWFVAPVSLLRPPGGDLTDERVAEHWGVEFASLGYLGLQQYIASRPDLLLTLTIARDDVEMQVQVTPKASVQEVADEDDSGKLVTSYRTVGQIGITFASKREYNAGKAIYGGLKDSVTLLGAMLGWLWDVVTGQSEFGAKGIIGMAAIAHEGSRVGWDQVLNLCGLISLNLAIINLLPLPVADGGRLVMIGYEAVVRRRMSSQREMAWLVAGAVFFIGLFIFLAFKDVFNLVKYNAP